MALFQVTWFCTWALLVLLQQKEIVITKKFIYSGKTSGLNVLLCILYYYWYLFFGTMIIVVFTKSVRPLSLYTTFENPQVLMFVNQWILINMYLKPGRVREIELLLSVADENNRIMVETRILAKNIFQRWLSVRPSV